MDDLSIKVLIVEDLRTVGLALARVLAPFQVVGIAHSVAEAMRMQEELQPHVITMDIHLPDGDGLELTRRIRALRPVPVLIVSSQVGDDTPRLVFEALRCGAYDVLPKSRLLSPGTDPLPQRLVRLVRAAANAEEQRAQARRSSGAERAVRTAHRTLPAPAPVPRLIAIGASTGGPAVLRDILAALEAGFPVPILVAQHMAEGFIEGLTRWLDTQTPLAVRTAVSGTLPGPATVYLPPSQHHLEVAADGRLLLIPMGGERVCPSVDLLFSSVARCCGSQSICLLLTGMGSDGAAGMTRAHERGALTAVQDAASSVIHSMPLAALRLGGVDLELGKDAMARWLTEQACRSSR